MRPEERAEAHSILQRIVFGSREECWQWIGEAHPDNGRPLFSGTTAMRAVFALFSGCVLPKRVHLHYRCENVACVNPWHAVPITQAGHNQLHGRQITQCKQGHPYDVENTYWRKNGTRDCRACNRNRQARREGRL